MGRLVDIDSTSLEEVRIGALPVVNRFISRLGLKELFEEYVPGDPRAALAYSASLLMLVQSLAVERAPVYKIGEWVSGREARLLGLLEEEIETLNDDRLGRALDALFRAGRASMLTKLMCQVDDLPLRERLEALQPRRDGLHRLQRWALPHDHAQHTRRGGRVPPLHSDPHRRADRGAAPIGQTPGRPRRGLLRDPCPLAVF